MSDELKAKVGDRVLIANKIFMPGSLLFSSRLITIGLREGIIEEITKENNIKVSGKWLGYGEYIEEVLEK